MSNLSIFRVASLPAAADLQPSSMYITRAAGSTSLVNLTFVGDSVSEVRSVFGVADAQSAIDAAIANLTADDIPNLPGSKIISDLTVNTSGNAATATLATRATNADNASFASTAATAEALGPGATINGVLFTGANNITVPAVDTATPRVPMSGIGQIVAPLVDGLIPTQYLPLGLDNVDIFPTRADFPAAGKADVIYVAEDTNLMYRWGTNQQGGGEYIQIPSGAGTADTAVKLKTARQIELEGAVTGEITSAIGFDGSQNVTITTELANVGAGGTGTKVTVNTKGQVTAVEALTAADVPALPGSKITSDISVNTTGNAATADKLKTARVITVSGAANGSVTFDGSGDASLVLTGAASGVTAGTYTKVTVNTAGLVTAGDALVAADIPNLPGTKIISDLTVNTSGRAATAGVADSAKSIELAASEW